MLKAILLILAGLSLGGGLVTATDDIVVMDHDGAERTYYVHVPETYVESDPMPLVLALHDFGSSGRGMAAMTDLNAVADEQGFIVAYPDVLDMYWDDGRVASGWPPGADEINDVGFLTQVLDDVSARYAVSDVYLAGFAQGGAMAYRLACAQPERFAAVAVVSALMWDYQLEACAETDAPVTMFLLIGTQDRDYPMAGRTLTLAGDDETAFHTLSAQATVNYWLGRNGCLESLFEQVGDARIYWPCKQRTRVVFDPLVGVGHIWAREGDYTLNQYGVDATEIVARFFADDDDWAAKSVVDAGDGVFGGVSRSYRAFVPHSYDPAQAMPLVIALHGRPDNGTGFAYRLDMNRVAQEQGFIVAYPDGIDYGWNYTRGSALFPDNNVDDDAFMAALVDDLAVDLNIDRDRVYLTGFSNGGFMTMRLACLMPGVFAGFAVVGAGFQLNFVDLCREAAPVPMMFIHGTEDVSIPWTGEVSRDVRWLLSFPDTVGMWVDINQCNEDPAQTTVPQGGQSPETEVHRFVYTGCADGSDLLAYAIVGGGHNLPGVPGRIVESIAGNVNMDIHAGEVFWEFLSQHRR